MSSMDGIRISMIKQFLIATHIEMIKAFRTPSFSLPTIILPVSFYLIFGLLMKLGTGAAYLLGTYIVFAAMAPGLFGVGISLVRERSTGWLDLLKASPANTVVLLVARVCMALLFAVISSLLIILLAGIFGNVHLPLSRWFALIPVTAFAALPFATLGLVIGMYSGKGGSSALANLFFLPMAVLSGLWFPLQVFPEYLQSFALFLPTYHVAQISLFTVEHVTSIFWFKHIAIVSVWTVIPILIILFVEKAKTPGWPHNSDKTSGA